VGVSLQRLFEVSEQLETNRQGTVVPKTGPQRRLAPVVTRKEPQQQIPFESRGEKTITRTVERGEGRIGLIPQGRIAVSMKQFDFFARFLQGGWLAAVRPAAQKAGAGAP